ncbi:SLC13 family permease [Nonomuraea soli]|uniref:Arsenical pump membrane protein n=1 Tax=Nonomuraea soli TaxID=1032476 RepID=A0A7W0CES3_9ACTN|nr:SLC13 family permease [Nonomuraea soli]MBA2889818.1 arsenical pump membrane protein [Nonomuraea soli]
MERHHAPRRPSRSARARPLLWAQVAVLAAGLGCVATGLLPMAEAQASMVRIAPILLFLTGVLVLAELTKQAGVFQLIAARLAWLAGGSYLALFLLCSIFVALVTMFLNRDTAAALLTPVLLALAPKARIKVLPVAIMSVWLADTASLLLPVSNLTNLLAMNRLGLSTHEFAARMWVPQVVSLTVSMSFLWLLYWRRGRRQADRYTPPEPERPADRVLFGAAALACALFVVLVLANVSVHVAALVAVTIVVAAFAARAREKLTWGLIPWQLLIFVTGLFLVVPTLGLHGLDTMMRWLIGAEGGAEGAFRAAAAGAALSNLVINLPAYVAGEHALAGAGTDQLLALLVGTNVGPIITPWASLSTLIWFEYIRRHRVTISVRSFMLAGALLAAGAVPATVVALLLTT